jgi:Cu(I)/Ag(I) efflux system protein CusF
MKRSILLALMFSVSLAAAAQGQSHKGVGVVKSVDPKKPGVTLAHEPIPSLRWPAMTMGFAVKDKALLEKLKPGMKIEFEMVQQGRDYVIISVK